MSSLNLRKAAMKRVSGRESPFLARPLNTILETSASPVSSASPLSSPRITSPLASFGGGGARGGGSVAASKSPVSFASPSLHMRERLNKEEGECRWGAGPTSSKIVPCAFPTPKLEEGGWFSVTLDRNFPLYRSEKHGAGKPKWFDTTAISETGKPHYWFATTEEHVQVFGGTHILTFQVIAPIKLLFIQNLYLQKGFKDGYDYLKSPKFLREMEAYGVDGYAGCNECEVLLTSSGLSKITQMPINIRNVSAYISGGARSRKVRRKRSRRGTRGTRSSRHTR